MALEIEQEEVKQLLLRHKYRIEYEIKHSNLIEVLVRKSVITSGEEKLLKEENNDTINHENKKNNSNITEATASTSTSPITNDNIETTKKTDDNNDEISHHTQTVIHQEQQLQCMKLIDLISNNGFEKFKDFCFAIETECPQLIEDLINDKCNKNESTLTTTSTETIIENKEDLNDETTVIDSGTATTTTTAATIPCSEKDKIDFEGPSASNSTSGYFDYVNSSTFPSITMHSYESTSMYGYSGGGSSINSGDDIKQKQSNFSPKFSNSEFNYCKSSKKLQRSSSTVAPSNSNYTSSLRQKLFHRFSDAATLGRRLKKKKNSDRSCYSMSDTIEVFADPVVEDDGERTSWEYHTVSVTRVHGYGFGIAVSGGRDNPHFANGDPSIAVSDVLKGGPAEDRLQVNDRIVSVNGVSLENVEYATAVQVLRDSGNTVTLVVKRRVTNLNSHVSSHPHSTITGNNNIINNSTPINTTTIAAPTTTVNPLGLQMHSQGQPIRVTLTKSSKKDDFGIVLGCRLFIKEISSKTREQLIANGYSLNEGDIITRIHNTNCNDTMSLKEAKKIIDGCKERLNLVVLRDITNQSIITNNANNLNNLVSQSSGYSHSPQQVLACNNNLDDSYMGGARYSSQNLYVQPPTRGGSISSPNIDEKSNLTPRGRSRGPLMDVSLSQLDRPSTPLNDNSLRRSDEPPRPPPPRGEDYYSCRRQLYEDDPLQRSRQSAEPRFISFQKEGSVGIRLTGGNEAGIFVTAVQPGSPASLQGLTPGDKILKVNDMDMKGVTREEAVLFLLSLQDRIDLIVQHCKEEYEEAVANQRGDSFHIKTHFHCDNPSKGEMPFKAGDVFRVIDTLHNGVVGSWQVLKIGRGHQEMQRGVIPNKSRAEELATAQFNATKKEMNSSESRGNFFKRRRTHRRSKSLSKENWDDVVFSDSISKFPAYERVVLRHPGFVRPVVLFGPISDLAREKLTKDFPDKFTVPLQNDDDKTTSTSSTNSKSRIVRLSNIRDIMDRGKHALLDITPNAVDRLNYAQFYPIVIFLKADSKHVIKQLRHGLPKSVHKSSKKLFEQCQKLEKVWSHMFSTTIMLNETDIWYRKLREAIDLQQSGAVWMSESKPAESLSDDFLFPMTNSRLSYASSPESDLELSPGPSTSLSLGNLPHLVKSSSDPSIATNQDNADRDRDIGEGLPPPYTHHFDRPNSIHTRIPSTVMENKYSFPSDNQNHSNSDGLETTSTPHHSQSIYGMNPPDLPPRIDRASKPLLPPSVSNNLMINANNQSTSNIASPNNRQLPPPSSHENLYGKQLIDDIQNNYLVSRHTDSMDRTQSSLERQRAAPLPPTTDTSNKTATIHPTQNGYDSVSSYESYNTTQLSVQNIRLGPNAPDDLKSVPSTRHLSSSATITNTCDYRNPHENNLRGFSGINDLNVQNSPGRPSVHEINSNRNIDSRGMPNLQQSAINQRPTNLSLENSPRKPVLETKTDYGKYRSNSASQADYSKAIKNHIMSPPNGGSSGSGVGSVNTGNNSNNNNVPFKPVPPPKPKNYRAPIQGPGNNHWDNGEQSPRSPNGFFYPPTPSHYHHSGSPHKIIHSGGNSGSQNHSGNYIHGNPGHISHPPPSSNGYNSNQHYGSHYVPHRGNPPPVSNLPIHSPERQALDLAGSREQRGSAFELYRKPQVGSVGHHHNVREMESNDENYYSNYRAMHHRPPPPSSQSSSNGYNNHYCNQKSNRLIYHQQQQQKHQEYQRKDDYYNHFRRQLPPPPQSNLLRHQCYEFYDIPPPLPPPLPAKKEKKKSLLKNSLAVLKNVITKTTRPLRRMSSMVEPERKLKPCLRRQYSLMERRTATPTYSCQMQISEQNNYNLPPSQLSPCSMPETYHSHRQEQYFSEMNSTYRNLEPENIYVSRRSDFEYSQQNYDDLYANRALIDLERRQAESKAGGRRIVRRHSMADRATNNAQAIAYRQQPGSYCDPLNSKEFQNYHEMLLNGNDKRAPGSEIMSRRRFHSGSDNGEPIYRSRMEMHRIHLYQSRKEMQERIAQGKKEIEREFSQQQQQHQQQQSSASSGRSSSIPDDEIYKSRREMMMEGYAGGGGGGLRLKSPVQLKDHIYQTRREALESMAEPSVNMCKRGGGSNGNNMMKHEPIYETKEECFISSKENITDERKEENHEVSTSVSDCCNTLTTSQDSKPSEHSNETVIENHNPKKSTTDTAEENCDNDTNSNDDKDLEETESISVPKLEVFKTPYHISSIIKRTAPMPPPETNASSTSIETQYTSQNSLPVGPPNATSTPFTSDNFLSNPSAAVESLVKPGIGPPRETTTTRGIFDENGGTLVDNVWNVSLHIPSGAIAPGVKQEIYFTVSDPRMSDMVSAPPLDMENGETMLSPLVMCGPQGLEFLVPVTLNIPHCAARTPSLGLSLKATDSEKSLHTNWDNIDLPSNTAAHTVSVKVDHF